jgi:hypothetical protein
MSRYPQTKIGNKIIDAQPEPQPEKPEWLEDGALVCAAMDLEPDTNRGRQGFLTYGRHPTTITVRRGDAGIYLGEERVSVTDRKGVTTRKVVHAFFIGGGKFIAEPGWFREYTGEKSKDQRF